MDLIGETFGEGGIWTVGCVKSLKILGILEMIHSCA